MANRILKDAGWEGRIRDKLGVDEAYLPNAALWQPDIITVAEAQIVRAVPGYAALTGDDVVFLEAAAICRCALQVLTSMPGRLPTRQKGPHMDVEITVDWDRKRGDLQTELAGYLELLGDMDTTAPTGIWLGGPNR